MSTEFKLEVQKYMPSFPVPMAMRSIPTNGYTVHNDVLSADSKYMKKT